MIRSAHVERHGTPQQAAAAGDDARGATLLLFEERVPSAALYGLEGMDYVWLVSYLHLNRGWNPMVLPPRGPKKKRGVLATRAPHRPNPLGLSAVRLRGIEAHRLRLGPVDLLDGTPIIDVKPYIPYADAFPEASAGWVDAIPVAEGQRGRRPNRKRGAQRE